MVYLAEVDRIIILNDIATWNRIGMSRYAGPYVIASRLREIGYDVRVVEWFTQHENPLELVDALLTPTTVAVCLSTTFLIPDPFAEMTPTEAKFHPRAIMAAYKKPALWFQSEEQCADWFQSLRALMNRKAPDARIVLGGVKVEHLYAHLPERIAALCPTVDYGLIGSADDTVVELFRDLRLNRKPYGVDRGGICFIKPLLVRDRCPAIRYEHADLIQAGEALPIEIKRGCAFNCKFCHYEKRGSTLKDLDVLRDEFVRNHDLFGTTLYTFTDDCFNDSRKNVEAVCGVLAKLPFKVEWVGYARADLAIKFPDTMQMMLDTGTRGLFFGIETFNYAAGRAAGKAVPPDKVKQWLLDLMRNYGSQMVIEGGFIAGLPHETDDTMQSTLDWIDQHRPLHSFRMAPLGLYEYNEEMDDTVIDYADYARHPEKYGFEEVRHKPDVYWKHATMDLPRAMEWSKIASQRWNAEDKPKPIFRSIWWYPSYRMLGLTHAEIMNGLVAMDGWAKNAEVRERWKNFSTAYWNQLVQTATL